MKISIVTPVYQESQINEFIGHLHDLQGIENCEIIICDSHPEQSTLKKIKYQNIIQMVSDKGRGTQMNTGAERAEGDVILFMHVDTRLPHNGLMAIRENLRNPNLEGGAFHLNFRPDSKLLKLIAKTTNLRSRITRVPYGDQCIFIRRKFFHKIGGYSNEGILEDVDLMNRVKSNHGIIKILPESVQTSSRRFKKEGVIKRMAKNRIIMILYWLGFPPSKLVSLY